MDEPLAIEFANTVRRRGMEYMECVSLVEWARRHDVRLAASRLDEVREFRDAVFALLRAATPPQDATPRPEAEGRLNAALAAVPLIPQLRDGDIALTAPSDAPPLDTLLARVAASALDLLGDPALSFCDAPSCGQLFLRHRGDQRWCGPACGTRARVARHAVQHRRDDPRGHA